MVRAWVDDSLGSSFLSVFVGVSSYTVDRDSGSSVKERDPDSPTNSTFGRKVPRYIVLT